MVKVVYNNQIQEDILKDKKIAIIGYGSQGHAHALNLKESGVDVVVGLREGSKSRKTAQEFGLEVLSVSEAAKKANMVMMLVPDEISADIYNSEVAAYMKEGDVLLYAHGFNIHYNLVKPNENLDVLMVAPKGPGHTVRSQYEQGYGGPSLLAVYQDYSGKAKDLGLAYAKALGAGRAGILETTFKEE